MNVSVLTPADEPEWDQFVYGSPAASFFHLSGWRQVIEQAFGHKTIYLVAQETDKIRGILPLTHVKSFLFGNSLISNAYCVRAGIVTDGSAARDLLEREALRLARELKVGWLEYRDGSYVQGSTVRSGIYANFRRQIDPDNEANMRAIPRKQRAVLRKAIAAGLRGETDNTVDRLHDIYSQSVHRLGSPVYPQRYFHLLKQTFGKACDIVTVLHQNRAIASVMNFYFRDEVLPYYGGGLEDARALGGNDFLYWEVMRRAAAKGLHVFDFGRSKIGTGAYHYKKNWGFDPVPLSYHVIPIRVNQIPDINPLNPKFRLAGSVWRRLPLQVTKVVGPMIVRSIG